MKTFILPIFLSVLLAFEAEAFSSGAPTTACVHMTPQHGYDPQTSPAPYVLTATPLNATSYLVDLTGANGETFQGFLIQARSNLTNTAVGYFENSPESWTTNCFDGNKTASTHFNTSDKTLVRVVWHAPATDEGFYFLATVAQVFHIFWVQIPGSIV